MAHGDLTLHAESSAMILATSERVFRAVDDHAGLSAHMSRSSWQMGGGRMETKLDVGKGRRVGSHIRMHARILGMKLALDEVITERNPPTRKVWETVGHPRLIVIGSYRMGFELTARGKRSMLRVFIDYDLLEKWPQRWIGWLVGPYYARWCTRSMVDEAARRFGAART